jgi:hypothetical protein
MSCNRRQIDNVRQFCMCTNFWDVAVVVLPTSDCATLRHFSRARHFGMWGQTCVIDNLRHFSCARHFRMLGCTWAPSLADCCVADVRIFACARQCHLGSAFALDVRSTTVVGAHLRSTFALLEHADHNSCATLQNFACAQHFCTNYKVLRVTNVDRPSFPGSQIHVDSRTKFCTDKILQLRSYT